MFDQTPQYVKTHTLMTNVLSGERKRKTGDFCFLLYTTASDSDWLMSICRHGDKHHIPNFSFY